MKSKARSFAAALLVAVLGGVLVAGTGCSRFGRVSESYPESFYRIPKQLPDDRLDKNPHFIVYGDNRPGWRATEVLGKKDTWLTWKQLYLPIVYQLYLVGSGVAGGFNYLIWNPDYGNSEARMVRDAIFERGRAEPIDLIVNTGDIVTDGRRTKDWKRFIEQNKTDVPLATEFPYLTVAGNHEKTTDSTWGLPNYEDVFSYPLFYRFECADVDFFVVDSDLLIDQYHNIDDAVQDELFAEWFVSPNAQEPAWLERELAASDKTFKFVFMHHPPISFSEHYVDWRTAKYGNEIIEKRRALIAMLEGYGVQVVFSGHQHSYERNTARLGRDDGGVIQYVITGGGGAPLRPLPDEETLLRYEADYTDQGYDITRHAQAMIYNYCVVDVKPDRVTIRAIEVSKSDDTNGRIVDEFVVTPSGDRR